jgi:hypothetical protein
MAAIPLAVHDSRITTGLSSELSDEDCDRGMICVPSEVDDEEEDADIGLEPLGSISTG